MSRLLGCPVSILFAALIVAVPPASYAVHDQSATTAGRAGGLAVEGYVPGWGGGAKAYLSDRRVVDLAGVDGVELKASADGITAVLAPAGKALQVVHRHHDRAEL